jgi:hypothetical protein
MERYTEQVLHIAGKTRFRILRPNLGAMMQTTCLVSCDKPDQPPGTLDDVLTLTRICLICRHSSHTDCKGPESHLWLIGSNSNGSRTLVSDQQLFSQTIYTSTLLMQTHVTIDRHISRYRWCTYSIWRGDNRSLYTRGHNRHAIDLWRRQVDYRQRPQVIMGPTSWLWHVVGRTARINML